MRLSKTDDPKVKIDRVILSGYRLGYLIEPGYLIELGVTSSGATRDDRWFRRVREDNVG
jgi:hypothetical protein